MPREPVFVDNYDRQCCGTCKQPLQLVGPWIYHDGICSTGIQPGKYKFQCQQPGCSTCYGGFVGSTEETIAHQRGTKFARVEAEFKLQLSDTKITTKGIIPE